MTEENANISVEAPPRPTTPDDLLELYAKEESNGVSKEAETNGTAKPAAAPEAPKEEAKPAEETKTLGEEDGATIKGRLNGEEVAIPLGAEITQEINGKEVTFKAEQAIQAYVKQEEFNRNMDRRVTKVAQREQALTNEMAGVKTKAIEVVNAALKGDFLSSIRSLAQLAAGKSDFDVVTFEKAYLDQLEKYHEAYSKMTPEQREKFFAERKASVYEEENKTLRAKSDRHGAEQALLAKVSQLCEENKIDPDDFRETFVEMSQKLVGEGKRWKEPGEITPEDVVSQVKLGQHYGTVFGAAKKVGFREDDPQLEQVVDEIVQMTFGRDDVTPAMIEQILERSGLATTAPADAVENLNRKAQKAGFSSQASSTKKEKTKAEGYDDMDLDELYRHAPRTYKRISR